MPRATGLSFTDAVQRDVAKRVGGLLWSTDEGAANGHPDGNGGSPDRDARASTETTIETIETTA
jgi:hypothetical protein